MAPNASGADLPLGPLPAGGRSGDALRDYGQLAFAVKNDINDRLSYAIILDQPFGADMVYDTGGSVNLGETSAQARAKALTALLRYKLDNRLSVHAGPRLQRSDGKVALGGVAYGAVNGYSVTLGDDLAWGYALGAAYEVPGRDLRIALTYNSNVMHRFTTTESGPLVDPDAGGPTQVTTPKSVNLDLQTSVGEDLMLFGRVVGPSGAHSVLPRTSE
ncbi:outer membrane protein transport protein, partial [Paradonghicola geojensis]|nr:outer membrane protein transport protein [Marivivens geojensis]